MWGAFPPSVRVYAGWTIPRESINTKYYYYYFGRFFSPPQTTTQGRDESVSGSSFSSVITFFIVFLVYRSREASLFHPLPPPPPRKKTAFVKPVQFFPPKKRILCLGCKICKDFFFFRFSLGKGMSVSGGGCIVHKTKNVSVKK